MATKMIHLCTKYPNINYLEAIRGDKVAEMFITLASTKTGVFIAVARVLSFKFPLTYNGKSEKWHLMRSLCRYFDKRFKEMFLI